MGGRLAAQFAEQHPEKIAKLTLLSAHLGLKTEEEKRTRLEKDQLLANKIEQIPIDEFLKEWYDQPLFQTLVASRDIRSMRSQQNREGIAQALRTFSLGRQMRIRTNAQLLVGEYDTAYLAHDQDLPHIVIPRAGHAAHLENPSAVARSLWNL
jgi:2-succinyl-6-hydroxy-2,4-cyclohexadiene-1-carboxylate synthase